MKYNIKVKANAKTVKIEQIDEIHLEVWVKEQAKDDKANTATIKALSKYFKVAQSQIKIVNGNKSKDKIIEINQ